MVESIAVELQSARVRASSKLGNLAASFCKLKIFRDKLEEGKRSWCNKIPQTSLSKMKSKWKKGTGGKIEIINKEGRRKREKHVLDGPQFVAKTRFLLHHHLIVHLLQLSAWRRRVQTPVRLDYKQKKFSKQKTSSTNIYVMIHRQNCSW